MSASPNRLASLEAGLLTDLQQSWRVPSRPRPIVIIGAGGIVRTAHLPVYQRLKFPVAGLFDIRPETSRETASRFGVSSVFSSLAEATATPETIFDVAVPGDQIAGVLRELPRGSAVLIQKPMGEDLDGARAIRNICQDRGLIAAMNFQLRFSPNVLALGDLIARRQLGDIVDIEVRLVVKQPWHLWTFLKGAPRLEILYHSVHYLDAIRSIAGEPRGVYCRAVAHPAVPEFRDTRSTVILDYGETVRCSLLLNHVHQQDSKHCASFLMIGMPISSVWNGDRPGPGAPNELDDRADVRAIGADAAVRQRQVLAPARAEDRARGLAFPCALVRCAVSAEFAPGQIAQPDAMAERDLLGDGPAKPDFKIVRMRAKDEQVDAVGHRPILFGGAIRSPVRDPGAKRRSNIRARKSDGFAHVYRDVRRAHVVCRFIDIGANHRPLSPADRGQGRRDHGHASRVRVASRYRRRRRAHDDPG